MAMPTRDGVRAFIAMVEAGDYVEAIRQFYTDDATMQENLGVMRSGLAALVSGEETVLKTVKEITTRPDTAFMVDGDRVAVNWVFDIVLADGRKYVLDEVAWQLWRGDRIAQERFYYDPAQRKPE